MSNFYDGRHFPRATMNILIILREGPPLHYLTIARAMHEAPNLCGARLNYMVKVRYVAKCPDLGRGWYRIAKSGLHRLKFLEANDPGR